MIQSKRFRSYWFLIGYLIFYWLIHLVTLTLITFSVTSTEKSSHNLLARVSDMMSANQLTVLGISALIFIGFVSSLRPLTQTAFKNVFDFAIPKQNIFKNIFLATLMILIFIIASAFSNNLSYLGLYLKFDEVVFSFFSAIFYSSTIILYCVVDEYLFRWVIQQEIDRHFAPKLALRMIVSTLVYLMVKAFQLDLNIVATLNFGLLNCILFLMAENKTKGYWYSATFLIAYYLINHVVFGFPFLGQDIPGIFLMRSIANDPINAALSGGANGPESALLTSFIFLVFLLVPHVRKSLSR